MEGREVILYFALKYDGDWETIYSNIKQKERFDYDLYYEFKEKYKDLNYVTLLDDEYPKCFKEIYKPPFIIFYKGNLNLLNESKTLGIIGSRNCSEYGKKATEYIIKDLNDEIVVVSGFAKGIDTCAHFNAFKRGLKTIAILGSGINNCYPMENLDLYNKLSNSNNGLIISEYPNFVEPKKDNFPFRNRLIAGLSKAILVSDANQKSGTSITVSYGLSYGKSIYCIPNKIDYDKPSFCNDLIREGAILVRSGNDINEDFK